MDAAGGLLGPETCWRIPDELWGRYEDSRLKQLKGPPPWHPQPVWQTDDDDFFNLIGFTGDDGVFLYGAFGLIVNRVAIVAPRRGYLVYYRRDEICPHTIETMAMRCLQTPERIRRMVDGLVAARWLETVPWPLEDASAVQAAAKTSRGNGRVFVPLSPLDEAIVAISGATYGQHDQATQRKVERYCKEYSEDIVINAIHAALKKQGDERTLGRALMAIGFAQAEQQKRRPTQVDEKPPVEF